METLRGYITKAEVEKYCDIAITDDDEAIERMEYVEQMIDDYVGFQVKFLRVEVIGTATSGTTTTLTDLSANSPLKTSLNDKFKFCTLEVLNGTMAGEERIITSQNQNTITFAPELEIEVFEGLVYKISQAGKFPRVQDFNLDTSNYYKYIPRKVKEACLAQFQYLVEMGDDFLINGADKIEERWKDYAYKLGETKGGGSKMISPKAKLLLKGVMNRKANLIGNRYDVI